MTDRSVSQVTTVSTTPLTKLLYPPWYQQKLEKWRRGEIDWDGNPLPSDGSSQTGSTDVLHRAHVRRLLVFLRLDSLPGVFTFISLLSGEGTKSETSSTNASGEAAKVLPGRSPYRPLEVHGIRMLELTERTSSVMQVTEGDEYSQRDPVVNTFRDFSHLNDVAVSGRVAVVPADSYAETLTTYATEASVDFALIPWGEYGSVTEDQSVHYSVSTQDRLYGRAHLEFINNALVSTRCNTGIFINNGFGGAPRVERPLLSRAISKLSVRSLREPTQLPVTDKSHHIFFPYFGGADDRAALRFVLQLVGNKNVSATIIHFNFSSADDSDDNLHAPEVQGMASGGQAEPKAKPTAGGKTMDEVTAQDLALLSSLQTSFATELAGRASLTEVHASSPTTALSEALSLAKASVGINANNAGDIVVVGRQHTRLGDLPPETGVAEFKRTMGAAADQIISAAVKASLLVIHAGERGP